MRAAARFFCLLVLALTAAAACAPARAFSMLALPINNTYRGVAWCGNRFVAVGDFGAVETSGDGVQWLPSIPISTNGPVRAIACTNKLMLVAGDQGFMMSSPDGLSWTQRSNGTTAPLYSVAASPSLFVAVGGSPAGQIFTSPDAITWTSRTNSAQYPLQSVVWTGTQFVALSRFGEALTSPDGMTWSLHQLGTPNETFGLAWSGTKLVAVGTNTVMTSPDGVTWTTQPFPYQGQINAVAWTGAQFVAVGQVPSTTPSAIFTSPDGTSWTPRDSDLTGDALGAVAASPTAQVVVGAGGALLSATDGQYWYLRMLGTPYDLHTVVKGNGVYVAAGEGGAIQYSRDSLTWLPSFSATTNNLFASASSPQGTIVLVGANGTILESVTGTTWADHSFATTNTLQGVTWAGTQFVAVGANGMVLTSPDAMTWTSRSSGTTTTLNAVTWDGSHLYTVGRSGLVMKSSDAISWSTLPAPSTNDLQGVARNGSQLVAVALNGVFYYTTDDGVAWSGEAMQPGLTRPLYGVAWNPEAQVFIVAGGSGMWGETPSGWTNFGGASYNRTLYGVGAGGRAGVGVTGTIFADTDVIFFGSFVEQMQ